MQIQNRDLKKYLVELVGTFILTLLVSLAISGPLAAAAPFLAAFTVGLFVYTVGHVSGAHFNPGITIGIWSIGKMRVPEAISYIVSQFAGAALSVLLVTKVLGFTLPISIPLDVLNNWQSMIVVGVAEAFGMFLFSFGVAAVVFGKVPEAAKGLVVGMSLFVGLILSSVMGASGIINPAVAFGINSFAWMYLVGPVVGAIAGMWSYRAVASGN